MAKMPSRAVLAVAAMLAAGCGFEQGQPTGPSSSLGALTGLWASSPSAASASSCTDFRWSVDQQSPTLVAGAFSAQCGGSIAVSGTAAGTLSGSTIVLQATGTATSQGFDCPFSLNGTGYIEGDSIRMPYTGQTCLGPIQGEETLRRQ